MFLTKQEKASLRAEHKLKFYDSSAEDVPEPQGVSRYTHRVINTVRHSLLYSSASLLQQELCSSATALMLMEAHYFMMETKGKPFVSYKT